MVKSIRQHVVIILMLVLCACAHAQDAFTLRPGDLLFSQELCGRFCNAIELSTPTTSDVRINHVAVALNDHQVIEAVQSGVTPTPLTNFIQRSQTSHHQTIWVKRLIAPYEPLISSAVHFAYAQIGKPYNASFTDDTDKSFYCSQLITRSFYHANHDRTVFQPIPMDCNNLQTHQPITTWQKYFKQRHEAVPQGVLGSNPMQLFKNPKLTLAYRYLN